MLAQSLSNEVTAPVADVEITGTGTTGTESTETGTEIEVSEPTDTSEVTEACTLYQQEVIDQLVVTNELLGRMSIVCLLIFGFMVFNFLYNLIRFNITNHFS